MTFIPGRSYLMVNGQVSGPLLSFVGPEGRGLSNGQVHWDLEGNVMGISDGWQLTSLEAGPPALSPGLPVVVHPPGHDTQRKAGWSDFILGFCLGLMTLCVLVVASETTSQPLMQPADGPEGTFDPERERDI